MGDIFLKVFNLSLMASWIVAAVIILRLLLKKAPKWINSLLWLVVGLRLVMPFSVESIFSLIPSAEPIPQNIATSQTPAINSGFSSVNQAVNPVISEIFAPDVTASVNPMQIIIFIASIIWVVGVAIMLIYGIFSYIRLSVKVAPSILFKDNIYYCDNINSPFILGVIKPKIFLPSGITESDIDYVIAHEKSHLKRCDHIVKPLGFLLLSFYWFNPLIWVAYILLCRDIESACDQKVIKDMDNTYKKGYLEALVSCSVHRRMILSCPLAFGEVGVKGRIKSVLNYKKPAFWIVIVAVITYIAVGGAFLTNPKTNGGTIAEKSGSGLDGLSVEVVSLNPSYIEIKWINDTENEIIFGQEFYILKQKNGKWKDCRQTKEYAWHTLAYMAKPLKETTHQYNLYDISLADDGIYRFESNCFIDGKPKQDYKVWTEFELKNGVLTENSFINDGEVFFYNTATDEHETPIIAKHTEFGNAFNSFLKTLKKQKWTDDYLTDRISFDFNGKISYSGNWIYFAYDQKVIYYDHYFCDVDENVIKTIKEIEEKAVDFNEDTNQNPYFNATVIEVYDNSVLVEPFSDEEIRKSSDQIYVGTDVISTNPVPNLKKGMQICVVYNGNILESYPAVINGVFAIYELDQNGEVIFIEDIVRHIFDPVEICYSNGMYSYIASVESLPTYEIINNMELYEMEFNGPHNLYGEMTEIKLTEEKFDSRFRTDMWSEASNIRKNNKTAWEIYTDYTVADVSSLYLLLEQNDGTFYLAVGYYNMGRDNPSNSDDSLIRWVYRLKEVDSLQQANPKPNQEEYTNILSEKTIKSSYLLSTKHPYGLSNIKIERSLTEKENTLLSNLFSFPNIAVKTQNDWVKFSPNHPNEYALAIEFTDNTSMIIAIHFTKNDDTYYIATAKSNNKFDENADYNVLEYERCIASENLGKHLCDIVFND